jgi:hypothetical protein
VRAESGSDRWIPGTNAERWLLFVLLIIALALRAWPGMAYVHDELSALIRLYPTLEETISKGVNGVDTHPPGVQIVLWGWTKIVGLGEWGVKLPFVLASVGALVLLYRLAARLAGTSVALVLIAVLATIQYTVLYGQLARPYAFGLLATAWMADALLRYRDTGRRGALLEIAAAAALSGWIHHIALLQALLMAASGLWLLPAPLRRRYLIAGAGALLLYAPNVPLLLRQFAWKGLDEWLAPPTASWFIDHARFVTHWSTVFGVALGALIAWSMVRAFRSEARSNALLIIGCCWGLLPYLIVFGYSVWRSPVLQHSVMGFAFPYVLLLLLAGLKDLPFRKVAITTSGLVVVSIGTLIIERHHFTLTDHAHSRYEVIARGIVEANATGNQALTDAPEHVTRFYHDRWNTPPGQRVHTDLTGLDASAIGAVLDSVRGERVFLGITLQAPPERRAQVQQRFPFLLARKDMAEGQAFLFGARPVRSSLNDAGFSSTCTPTAVEGSGWNIAPAVRRVPDTAAYTPVRRWSMAGQEFGVVFHGGDLGASPNDLIEAEAQIQYGGAEALMVVEVNQGEQVVAYSTGPFCGSAAHLAVTPLANVTGPVKELAVNAYVWNRGSADVEISSVALRVRQGNPVQYGLLGPIHGNWTYR